MTIIPHPNTPRRNAMDAPGEEVVKARHPEYSEHFLTWRWLADSLEGGERYRDAEYGTMSYPVANVLQDEAGREMVGGLAGFTLRHSPLRNLIRHPQEFPTVDRAGLAALDGPAATNDEYEFRRALTPVPSFVAEAVGIHLSQIYAREVRREAPEGPAGDGLRAWWDDVDGAGTTVDDWMQETVAPLFLALGQIDLMFGRPPAPDGEAVENQADVIRLRLDRVVAAYALPENVTDWDLAPDRSYARVVTVERRGAASDGSGDLYREWTPGGWTLYDGKGRVRAEGTYPFGRVPVLRAFDARKPRCDNVGQPRYGAIAENQRAYYNVDSELTLSNSLAAHGSLSGPEKMIQGDSLAVGPGHMLPKWQGPNGEVVGWEYVTPSSEAADKLRTKLADIREAVDRAACLTKPAGAAGAGANAVSQSGVSKMLDSVTGHTLLAKIGKALQRLEMKAARMALTVLNGGEPDAALMQGVVVAYPTKFDLFSAGDFAGVLAETQAVMAGLTPELPEANRQFVRTLTRLTLPGLDDDAYQMMDDEAAGYIDALAERARQSAEGAPSQPGVAPGQPPPGAPPAFPANAAPGAPAEVVGAEDD